MEIHGDGPISDSEMTLHRELIKLRSENSALRARIEVLEKAVEWAIDNIDWDDTAVLKEMTGIGELDDDEKDYLRRRAKEG